MSKKKDVQTVAAAEDLGAAVVDTSSTADAVPLPHEGKVNDGGAAEGDGAEILRGAQDDESLVQGGEDTSSGPAGHLSLEGKANDGGAVEAAAKVKLIADRNGTVPEIKDGNILLRAAFGATVYANARRMIGCGVFVEIPAGYAGFILPSLRLRESWGIVCQGVRMPGESGEVSVTLINCGIRDCDIQPGEVIAEMVIVPCLKVEV